MQVVRTQIIAGFIIILTGMGILTYLSSRNKAAFLQRTREIIHYNQILYHSEQTRSTSMDLETGQRGFTITGDSAFLSPYHTALGAVDENVEQLSKLLSASSFEKDLMPELRSLISRKNKTTSKIIHARNHSYDSARVIVASYAGKNVMDSIRLITDEIESYFKALLVIKRRERENEVEGSEVQVILTIGVSVVMLIGLFVLIDYNFSRRIKAEASLQSALDDKNELYNNAPCGYFTLNEELIVTNVNDTFLSKLGYSRDEILSQTKVDKILHADSNGILDTTRDSGESIHTVDIDFIAANGRVISGTSSVQIVHEKDNKIYRCSVIDCTEKRLAEKRIIQLNKELEEFSYSVSHDLRAPLRLIIGYNAMMQEDDPGLIHSPAMEHLNIIISNARKMNQLIDDLLVFARLGGTEVCKEFVDFNDMVHSTSREIMAMEGREVDFNIGKLAPVESDVLLMKQVWINLISNAIKYSSKRDSPKIEIGSFLNDGNEVCYFVRDNGVGFNMKYSNKLFNVFQRLHREDEFPGTGVGLALVKKIICRQGGSIWAESEPDKGATFYFSLPNS